MNKKIIDYVPVKNKRETEIVSCRLPKDLVDNVDRIREKEGLSWAKLIEACLRRFLDEEKPRNK